MGVFMLMSDVISDLILKFRVWASILFVVLIATSYFTYRFKNKGYK